MNDLSALIDNNREWAKQTAENQPGFFEASAQGQSPEVLWIGCADSRVPPNTILNLPPGSVFVHRNIANQALPGDLNCESVIQYAVQALKVKHIIVCGHYGCGGVAASMNEPSLGKIEGWLDHLREAFKPHADAVSAAGSSEEKQNLLCELNVKNQVENVCQSEFVREAWANGQPLQVHGWIFDLASGHLNDLGLTVTGS
jgi:carbonic anhydrase